VGFRFRSHIAIDTAVIFLPQNVRRFLSWIVDAGVLLLLAIFVWQGFRLAITAWSLEYPAMEISRGYLYLSLPVGACLMAVAIIQGWRGRGLRAAPREERS
jgi:TRAP-type C4-dicarboxylate transport system permease small subunit